MYSVNFKKKLYKAIYSSKLCGLLVLESVKRSVINIRNSMLDVRCWTFASVRCCRQAEFHTSAIAGLKSGQFNQKKNTFL